MSDSISSLLAQDKATTEEISYLSPYDSAPVTSDQRQSYRYPAQPGREMATIRAGRSTLKAELSEESAGGMAIQVPGACSLKVNDEVEVGIYTGWYRARVIHVQPTDGGHRVGMQRISIISSSEDGPRQKDKSESAGQTRNLIAVGFVAMAVGIGATHFIGGQSGNNEISVRSGIPIHFGDDSSDHFKGVLNGVNILLEPQVSEGLKLSESQQESIEGVLIGASNSLAQAHDAARDKPPEVWYRESQSIVNDALENILCGLTDEQILKWRALMLHQRDSQPRN